MAKLVDAKALARRFGVSVDTVRAWTRQRRIPCLRINRGVVRYSIDAVERAIERPVDSHATGRDACAENGSKEAANAS